MKRLARRLEALGLQARDLSPPAREELLLKDVWSGKVLCGPWHRERTAVIVTVSVAAVRRINTELFLRKNVKDRHGLILCFFWGEVVWLRAT